MALWRVQTAGGERLAHGPVEGGPVELLREDLDALLAAGTLEGTADGPVPAGSPLLAPVAGQEVWAAGVTYAASRSARNDESKGTHDLYDKVYDAERPELFFKAAPGRVRGPGGLIGVRADSGWDVPEPEQRELDRRDHGRAGHRVLKRTAPVGTSPRAAGRTLRAPTTRSRRRSTPGSTSPTSPRCGASCSATGRSCSGGTHGAS